MGISLTAGMRSNLFNLQQTAKLMDQTAIRLNTGKKVNSALDDPISYFTAKDHMSRASDLATLKNGMSEGVQTITAANNGVESIMALLADAKSKAESAKSADFVETTVTLSSVTEGNTVTVGGVEYTCTTGGAAGTFEKGTTDTLTAANLAAAITTAAGVLASSSEAVLSISFESADVTEGTVVEGAGFVNAEADLADSAKAELASQYNELLSQIDAMVDDSGYKGINLLKSDDTLTVNFEGTNKLDVDGFDADHETLGVSDVTTWTTASADLDGDISKLDAAVDKLETKSSALASSLSIVTVRQDFTENMINTLTTGADNLTLADMNEEGANMLMLQTQQALGTNSLALAAETAQGVLRLF